MSSTAIDFPSNRSQLDPSLNSPPYDDVPLLDGDIFVAAGSSYTWTLDTGETYGRWRNEDPGATGDGRYVKLEDAGKTQVINGGGVLSINDKVKLDGGDGSGTFDGTVKVGGNSNFVNVKADGGITAIDQTNDQCVWINNSAPGAIIINDVNSTTNGKTVLNADGSAEFAGDVQVAGNPKDSAGVELGTVIRSTGGIISSTSSTNDIVFSGKLQGQVGNTSQINGNGSATFDHYVLSNRYAQSSGLSVNYNGTDYGYACYDQSELKAGITTEGAATFAGGGTFGSTTKIFDTSGGRNVTAGLCRSNSGQSYGLTIAPADDENNFTAFIKADGSASFEGAVDFGSYNAPNDTNGIGAKIYPTGNIYLRNDDGPVIRGYNKGVSGPTSEINADGSAEFSGQLVAGKVSNSTKYFRWRDSDGVTIYDNVATGSSELFKVISNDGSSLKTQISFTANGSATFAADKFQIASNGTQKIIGTGLATAGAIPRSK